MMILVFATFALRQLCGRPPPPPRASSSPVMLYVNLRTNRTKLVFAAAVYTKLKHVVA